MSLPGNVHHEIASTLGIKDDDARAVVEAMLAVAWEQRTANLIALMHHAAGFSHGGCFGELYADAAERLGLGASDD